MITAVVNGDNDISDSVSSQSNSLFTRFIGQCSVLLASNVSLRHMRISSVDCNPERLFSPCCRIDVFGKFFDRASVLTDERICCCLERCKILIIERTRQLPRLVLNSVGTRIPECVEVLFAASYSFDLEEISTLVSALVCFVEECC